MWGTLALIFILLWLLGGIIAFLMMWFINVTILPKISPDEKYSRKEFFIGFIGSWLTITVVVDTITTNL